MSKARFKVRLDQPIDGAREATILIDRKLGLVHCRAKGHRHVYGTTLSTLAALICWRSAHEDAAQEQLAKRKKRGRR